MKLISVRLSTFQPGTIIPFDVYVQVGSNQVHYLRSGDEFDRVRFEALVTKGARRLLIGVDAEKAYHAYLDSQLLQVKTDANEAKAIIAKEVTEDSAEMTMRAPGESQSYQMAQSSTEILKKILSGNSFILRDLVSQEKFPNATLTQKMKRHMINTATIAIKFAQQYSSSIDISKLGVAAFYHDVSFVDYAPKDQQLFFKELSSMTSEELTIYKAHPQKSAMVLQDKGFAEREVIDLIMTHEEKISGEGFPGKLMKLSLTQQVLSLAAFYDREVTCLGKQASDVQADLMVGQLGNYELELLKSFASFVKSQLLSKTGQE